MGTLPSFFSAGRHSTTDGQCICADAQPRPSTRFRISFLLPFVTRHGVYPAFVLHPRFPPNLKSLFAPVDIVYSHCTLIVSYSTTSTRTAAAVEENICVQHGWQECCCTAVAIHRLYIAGAAPLYYRYAGAAKFSCCPASPFRCTRIYGVVVYDIRSTSTTGWASLDDSLVILSHNFPRNH